MSSDQAHNAPAIPEHTLPLPAILIDLNANEQRPCCVR